MNAAPIESAGSSCTAWSLLLQEPLLVPNDLQHCFPNIAEALAASLTEGRVQPGNLHLEQVLQEFLLSGKPGETSESFCLTGAWGPS